MSSRKSLPKFEDLTSEQQEVVQWGGQGLAVIAGAGAGKTTTLVIKMEELMKRNPKARIAAVSFTEKSALDIRSKFLERMLIHSPSNPLGGHWITTIHGLCRQIITEFPEEAGAFASFQMLDAVGATRLWKECLDSLWTEAQPPEIISDLKAVMTKLSMLEFAETLTSFSRVLRRINGSADRVSLVENLSEKPKENLIENPRRILNLEGDPVSKLFFNLTERVLQRYQKSKRTRLQLDFDDLEICCLRALRVKSVQKRLQMRFDLFLVDEFQDTNPMQAEIVRLFSKPDFSNVCIIGDPKQSIYRFRDADVQVFYNFCRELPKELQLTKNFRSHPGILETVNEICAPVFESALSTPLMKYVPLYPPGDAPFLIPHLHELTESQSLETPPVSVVEVATHAELGGWIREQVKKGDSLNSMVLLMRQVRGKGAKWISGLNEAGIPLAIGSGGRFWSDPRVLEMVAFLKAFMQDGVFASDGSPQPTLPWLEFLRSPWMRGSWDLWLDEMILSKKSLKTEFLLSTHPLAMILAAVVSPVGQIVEPLVTRPGQLLLKLLEWDEFPDEMQMPCLQLWHKVENWSIQGQRPGLGMTAGEILRELESLVKDQIQDKEVPPPEGTGQLRVLTIHGSKGLEFDHVIIVDFGAESRKESLRPFYTRFQEGQMPTVFFTKRDESGAKDKEDIENSRWSDDERMKQAEEAKRLFYVGLTRAKKNLSLILIGQPELDEKLQSLSPEEARALADRDFWRAWVRLFLNGVHKVCFSSNQIAGDSVPLIGRNIELGTGEAASQQGDFWGSQSHIENDRDKKGFPGDVEKVIRPRYGISELLKFYEYKNLGAPKSKSQELGLKTGETGLDVPAHLDQEFDTAQFGTLVHQQLEDFEEAKFSELERRFHGRIDFNALRAWIRDDHPSGYCFNELGFEFEFSGEILVGKMDRLEWMPDENVLRISDFKITVSEKTTGELWHQYEPQLMCYAYAAYKLLKSGGALKQDPMIQLQIIQISRSGVQVHSQSKRLEPMGPEMMRFLENLRSAVGRAKRFWREGALMR